MTWPLLLTVSLFLPWQADISLIPVWIVSVKSRLACWQSCHGWQAEIYTMVPDCHGNAMLLVSSYEQQAAQCVCMYVYECVCMYVCMCVCVCVLTCCRAIDLETKYLRRGTQQATNMPIPCNLQPTHKHTHTAIRQSYQMLLSSMSLMQSYTCDMLNSLPCHVTCRQLYR